MRRRSVNPMVIVIIALVLVIAIGAVIWIFAANVLVNGHLYPKKSEFLNLRGKELTTQEYDALQKKLPNCDIYWDVPLSEGTFPENIQILEVSSLTDEDVESIRYFEGLLLVEAENCRDYPQLAKLKERYPDLAVIYNVVLGGETHPFDAAEVTLTSLSDEDIENVQYLPNLKLIQAGQCGDYAQVEKLKARYPNLTVATTVTIGGQDFAGETTQLTATGVTAEEAARLKYLPDLQSVHLVDPAMPLETLEALQSELPNVTFSWDVTVAGQVLHHDATEVEIANATVDVEQMKNALSYLPNLESLFLNECIVDNDAMAALRDEVRSQYKVVWTVQCGPITVRTDATYFYPVGQYVWYFFDEDAANLVYCEDMLCVDLGHMSIHHVQWLKGMPKLKYLILAHTQVSDLSGIENCKELVFLEVDWSIVKDFTPLIQCTALEDLNIGKTFADVTPLTQMTWLKHLWCVGRGEAAAATLNAALAEHGTMVFFRAEATVGGIWRQLPNYYAMRDTMGAYYMN